MRLFTAFLPIALITSCSVNADEACTTAYDAARPTLEEGQGDSCTEVDGMCPDTCAEFIATLDSACAGKSYTEEDGKDTVYNKAISVATFQFSQADGACADADLTPGEDSCTEAYTGSTLEIIAGGGCRQVDGMCPDSCEEIFTVLDSACTGKSYTGDDGEEREYYHFTTVANFQLAYIFGACADADLTPGEDTCEELITELRIRGNFGDSCEEVDGMCPDTCEKLFTTADSACDGKSFNMEGKETKYNRDQIVREFSTNTLGACADTIRESFPILGTDGAPILGTALVTGSIAIISSFLFL